MLIKLNYSTAKTAAQVWRVVADIIQNTSVNSIAALRVRQTAASYNSDLLQGLVDTTSYIVRSTDITANTTCHIARPSVASGNFAFEFILKQKVYDASSTYVVKLDSTLTTGTFFNSTVGTSTGDTAANQWDVTASSTQSTSQGSPLGVGGTLSPVFSAGVKDAGGAIYTLWVYLTDTCFVWAANRDTYTISGFPANGWDARTFWNGPHIYSQYTRGDYWNTDANGIIPLVFTQHTSSASIQFPFQGKSYGEGLFSRESEIGFCQSIYSNTPSYWNNNVSFQFLNGIDNTLSNVYTTRAVQSNILGVPGIISRWADMTPLGRQISADIRQPSLSNSYRYDSVLLAHTALSGQSVALDRSNYRYISEDLQSYYGYVLYPLSVRNSLFNMNGGNITDRSGLYLFNGDFFPGDEVTVGGITYALIPVGMNTYPQATLSAATVSAGTQSRIALAVPKS